MKIKTILVSPFQQNARIVIEDSSRKAWLVDPGDEAEKLVSILNQEEAECEAIIMTHAHLDHIGAVETVMGLLEKEGIVPRLYGHKEEAIMRQNIELQATMFGVPDAGYKNVREPDHYLEDGMVLKLGPYEWKALFTPGHSPGHIAFYYDGGTDTQIIWDHQRETTQDPILIAGDTVFENSIGRTDLPGGDHQTLLNSIQDKILSLPDQTRLLSGHGPDTTVGKERVNNPFLK